LPELGFRLPIASGPRHPFSRESLLKAVIHPSLPMGAESTMWKITTHHLGPMSKLPADRAEAFVVFSILLIFRILRFVVLVFRALFGLVIEASIYADTKVGRKEKERQRLWWRERSGRKGGRETKIMVAREKGVKKAVRKYSHLPF